MANVQQQRLTPEQEREIAQRILGLEDRVRALVASVPEPP